jgi:hypothetical protein
MLTTAPRRRNIIFMGQVEKLRLREDRWGLPDT